MYCGLFNTLAIFQGYVNKILAKKFDIFIIVYLDNILIYIKNPKQFYVKIICLVLDKLQKYSFFANLKKYWFHQKEICFLEYVVLSKKISMEAIKIKIVKDWLKLKLFYNIQVLLDFINFY